MRPPASKLVLDAGLVCTPEKEMLAQVFNFLLFQAAWLSAILGTATHHPWAGCVPALAATGWQVWRSDGRWKAELALALAVAAAGLVTETGFIAVGLLTYADNGQPDFFPPVPIVALWLAFGPLPHGSLAWLSGRPVVQSVLGAVSGPLSYFAGSRLGAAEFQSTDVWVIIVIGLAWAAVLPLIFRLADLSKGWFLERPSRMA